MGTECLTRLYLKHPLPDSPAHSATAGRFVAPWWRWVFIIKIMWRYTEITPEDLEIGDHISITFTGEVLESYPAQIQQVDIIQLLDDER